MERHTTAAADIPKWSALLVEAVNKPGLIMDAYSAFHSYSIGNQILAIIQCQLRGLEPGPINTFPGWQALGRNVKRGERALLLCMPITRKRRDEESDSSSNELLWQTDHLIFRGFLSETAGVCRVSAHWHTPCNGRAHYDRPNLRPKRETDSRA